jgi:hypothetical protein
MSFHKLSIQYFHSFSSFLILIDSSVSPLSSIAILNYKVSTVSPSSTQVREIGSIYPGFAIMVAIGLCKPYAKPELGANLVLA